MGKITHELVTSDCRKASPAESNKLHPQQLTAAQLVSHIPEDIYASQWVQQALYHLRCVAASEHAKVELNVWKEAVIDAHVVNHTLNETHMNNPAKALGDLITYEQQLALDPSVSKEAQALIDRGAAGEHYS